MPETAVTTPSYTTPWDTIVNFSSPLSSGHVLHPNAGERRDVGR